MADVSPAAARVLRLLLGVAVLLLVPGLVFAPGDGARLLQRAGLWVLALGPFVVLIVVSAGQRRTRWFAAATITLVAIGFMLAR